MDYIRGVPPFICEDEWVDRALRVGKKMLGEENTKIMPYAAMGGEDFVERDCACEVYSWLNRI